MHVYYISLEAARVNAGMNQKQVAAILNVNVGTISNWENGKTAPDANQFKALCTLYGCPMDIIFFKK